MPADAAGADLVAWLARRFAHTEASGWARRLAAGEIAVDGRVVTTTAAVRPGREVAWSRPPWDEPEVPRGWAVRFEDADVLVVSKPSGLPTMPAGGFLDHTLLAFVRAAYPDATPMHRLGRGTSGLVLFGRTARARSSLQASLRDGRVEKLYRALASGSPAWDSLGIDVPIGPMPHERLGTVFAATPDGKRARSGARVLERRGDAALLEVSIETGRPHQIRIHLAAVGHPLVGDPLYGPGGRPRCDALPGDLGYALHAIRLVFPHPATGARVAVDDPPPPILATDG